MNEHIVTKQHMDALRALADTNLKISEAKNTLTELEKVETEYLVSREKKAMNRVALVLDGSRDVLLEAKANHDEVERFHQTISAFSDFLKEGYTQFKENVTLLDEKMSLWSVQIERQEAEIAQMRELLSIDRVKIANEKKNIQKAKKEIEETTRKLASDRGTLERAIERLKDNRI